MRFIRVFTLDPPMNVIKNKKNKMASMTQIISVRELGQMGGIYSVGSNEVFHLCHASSRSCPPAGRD